MKISAKLSNEPDIASDINFDVLEIKPDPIFDDDGKILNASELESFNHPFYKDEKGEIHGTLKVDKIRLFVWVNDNMKKIFGFNDGIVTSNEWAVYCDYSDKVDSILEKHGKDGPEAGSEINALHKSYINN